MDFELVAVRVQKICLPAPKNSVPAIFQVKYFDSVLLQKLHCRCKVFGCYLESMMHRSLFQRVIFYRSVLCQDKVIIATLEEDHTWSFLDDFHPQKLAVELRASLQICNWKTEVNNTLSFNHCLSPESALRDQSGTEPIYSRSVFPCLCDENLYLSILLSFYLQVSVADMTYAASRDMALN